METEKDFLSQYSIKDYERPSLTTDIVAFMIRIILEHTIMVLEKALITSLKMYFRIGYIRILKMIQQSCTNVFWVIEGV